MPCCVLPFVRIVYGNHALYYSNDFFYSYFLRVPKVANYVKKIELACICLVLFGLRNVHRLKLQFEVAKGGKYTKNNFPRSETENKPYAHVTVFEAKLA